jgi:hypothetical protein
MKATKRFLSAIMAMTMVCGTAVTVSAEGEEPAITAAGSQANAVTGAMDGTGTPEGWVETKIMRVVLPTDDINYTVDAHGLVKKSYASGAKNAQNYAGNIIVYSNKDAAKPVTDAKVAHDDDKNKDVLDDGFVFFSKYDAKTKKTTMANYMDLVLENKSSYPVDITPALTFNADGSGLSAATYTMTTQTNDALAFNLYEKSLNEDKKTYTYKEVKPSGASSVSSVKAGDAEKYYKTTYDTTNKTYNYSLDEASYIKDTKLENKATFTIEAISVKEKFTSSVEKGGKISIVWSVKEHTETSGG